MVILLLVAKLGLEAQNEKENKDTICPPQILACSPSSIPSQVNWHIEFSFIGFDLTRTQPTLSVNVQEDVDVCHWLIYALLA